jgi:uncharacterized protein
MALARPVIARRAGVTPATATVLIGGLVLLGVAVRAAGPERVEWLRAAGVVFGSLVIQAIPFVLIGALAAALIEVFVPVRVFEAIGRFPRPLQLPVAALAGMALPICECGSVPVARRLLLRGLAPSTAITFMLAAPVVNPVVIASTIYAYGGRTALWTMVLGRLVLGMIVAIAVGWTLGALGRDDLLRAAPSGATPVDVGTPEPRWRRLTVHLAGDFLFLGRYLLLGAAVAAAVQTFLPQQALAGIAATPIVDAILLMVLAAVLSLCSESDAFIAASFARFGPSAQLAFLVFGPMVDLKLGALYAATFRRRAAVTIVAVAAVVTLIGATWIGVLTG